MSKRLWLRPPILLFVVLLVAALLRVYQLDVIPPGLHRDEAYNGLDVLRVLWTGEFPIFFEANEGREPLFIYLQAVTVWLWGTRAWSLRIVSACVGVVTVALTYRLGEELSAERGRARWLGLIAAGGLAVSYWHIEASRVGLRAICLPATSLVALWFFWRGWQGGNNRDWLISGAALGVTLYTYTAARLLPFVLLGFLALQATIWLRGRQRRSATTAAPNWLVDRRTRGLWLLGLTSLMAAAPLGIFFWNNPVAFSLHQDQLAVFNPLAPSPDGLANLATNLIDVIRTFVDRGDPWIGHNIPGRPALDIVSAWGFWVGLVVTVVQAKRPAYALVLTWLVVMLIPTLLTEPTPNYVRAIGALPPVFLLVADGWLHLWKRFAPRMSLAVFVVAAFGLSGAINAHDYFLVWAPSAEVYHEFDAGIVTLALQARELARTTSVVMPLRLYGQPAPQFLLASHFLPTQSLAAPLENQPLTCLTVDTQNPDSALVILRPAVGGQATAQVPSLLPQETRDLLRRQFAQGDALPIRNRAGNAVAAGLVVNSDDLRLAPLQPERALTVDFGGEVRLIGYDLSPKTVAPNEKVNLVLYWQSLGDLQRRYDTALALRDTRDFVWSLNIREPWSGNFSTDLWRKGEILPDMYTLRVPAQAHPGKYQFDVGLVRDRLPAVELDLKPDGSQRQGNQIVLGPITVAPTAVVPATRILVNASFGDPPVIALLGYDMDERPYSPGDTVPLGLVWRRVKPMDVDYTVFVHVVDDTGQVIAQHDGQPVQGDFPTSLWFENEVVEDVHALQLATDVAPGGYKLTVGLYNLKTGERLAAYDQSGTRGRHDELVVRELYVSPRGALRANGAPTGTASS